MMTFDSPIGIYGKLCRIDCCCCCASVQHIFRTKSGLLPNWAAVYQYVAGVLAMLLYAVCLVLRKHYAYYVSWVQAHYQVYDGTIGRVESYYTYSYGSLYDTYIFTYVRVDNSSTTNTDEESRRTGGQESQPCNPLRYTLRSTIVVGMTGTAGSRIRLTTWRSVESSSTYSNKGQWLRYAMYETKGTAVSNG